VASHGAEALAQLRAGSRPCVILLDLMIPVMDGGTFCEERERIDQLMTQRPAVPGLGSVPSGTQARSERRTRVLIVDDNEDAGRNGQIREKDSQGHDPRRTRG
jgi:PleD family two-component response regulator